MLLMKRDAVIGKHASNQYDLLDIVPEEFSMNRLILYGDRRGK